MKYVKKYVVVLETIVNSADSPALKLVLASTGEPDDCEIAVFNNREEAEKWLNESGEVDTSCFDCYIIGIPEFVIEEIKLKWS